MSILFPENIYCISCSEPIPQSNPYSLCKSCYNDIAFFKGKRLIDDDVTSFLKSNGLVKEVYLAAAYENTMKKIIHSLKFAGKTYVATYLARILFDFLEYEKSEFDYISSTPIHKSRLRKRGYNQVDIIVKHLSELTGKEIITPAIRIKKTTEMYQLHKNKRREQLRDAFKSETVEKLSGKTLLIVDDILTTGSTMYNLAHCIKSKNENTIIKCAFISRAKIHPK